VYRGLAGDVLESSKHLRFTTGEATVLAVSPDNAIESTLHFEFRAKSIPPTAALDTHPAWDTGSGWKRHLNSLRLLLQPYVCACLL